MSGNENLDVMRRWLIGGLFGILAVFCLGSSCVLAFRGQMDDALTMVLLGAFLAVVVITFLFQRPIVDMDDEGVHVQVLFKKRFYPWNSLKQAGVLTKMEKFKFHGRLVLLKENGSPRREDDAFFMIRNLGRVIQLPAYNWMIKEYVEQHYGSLDFDDSAR